MPKAGLTNSTVAAEEALSSRGERRWSRFRVVPCGFSAVPPRRGAELGALGLETEPRPPLAGARRWLGLPRPRERSALGLVYIACDLCSNIAGRGSDEDPALRLARKSGLSLACTDSGPQLLSHCFRPKPRNDR